MKYSLIFLMIAAAIMSANLAKGDANNVEYDATKNVDHTITFFDSAGTANIHLSIKYQSSDGSYTITPDSAKKPIVLYEPLNIQYFRNEIQHFVESEWKVTKAISPASINEMFLSIYYTKLLNEEPVWSGNLILNSGVQVYDENLKDSVYVARDHEVDSLEGRLLVVNSDVVNYKAQLDDRLTALIDSNTLVLQKVVLSDADKSNLTASTEALKKLRDTYGIIEYGNTTPSAMQASKFTAYKSEIVAEIDAFYKQYWQKKRDVAADIKSIDVQLRKLGVSKVKKVSLQFERGFLERIQVWVEVSGHDVIFENIYAIGFSSIGNFRQFSTVRLFARDGPYNEDGQHIFLSDVFMNYDNILDNFTRDFSPADTSINNWAPSQSLIRLRKESVVNLFDSKIYSDLNGLRDNSPNGLVQIEVSRRFNIKTQRYPAFHSCDWGYAGYTDAWGAITKLENKQKFLPLRNADIAVNDTIVSPSYATTLDFLRYETAELGLDFNAFLFDIPNNKVTFYLDIGSRYGYTPVIDAQRYVDTPGRVSFRNTTGFDSVRLEAHHLTLFPRLSVEVLSQRRVGFKLSYQPQYTLLFSNNNFKQIASYAKSDVTQRAIEPVARWTHMVEFFLRAETSREASSRLFLRARFYWQQGDVNTFFPQFQLGYAYNLFFKR